jgi:hypothetical protein
MYPHHSLGVGVGIGAGVGVGQGLGVGVDWGTMRVKRAANKAQREGGGATINKSGQIPSRRSC